MASKKFLNRLISLFIAMLFVISAPVTAFAFRDYYYVDGEPEPDYYYVDEEDLPPIGSAIPPSRPPYAADLPTMPLPTRPSQLPSAPHQNTAPQRRNLDIISHEQRNSRVEGMDVLGNIPFVNESFGAAYYQINEYIADAIAHLTSEARRVRARSITFDYEVHPTDDLVSVVIYATVSSVISRTLVQSVNFSPFSGNVFTVNEFMRRDILSLAERILAEKIRSNPARYYAALSAPLDGQAFYLTDDSLVLLFDEFRLTTARGGVDHVELVLMHIRDTDLRRGQYRSEGAYNLRMIPLRHVLEGLGYRVSYYFYNDEIMRVEVWHDSRLIIKMRPYFNEYEVVGTLQRSLESAPEINANAVYVPITFFDQILPLTTYNIDEFGNIMFLAYLGQ